MSKFCFLTSHLCSARTLFWPMMFDVQAPYTSSPSPAFLASSVRFVMNNYGQLLTVIWGVNRRYVASQLGTNCSLQYQWTTTISVPKGTPTRDLFSKLKSNFWNCHIVLMGVLILKVWTHSLVPLNHDRSRTLTAFELVFDGLCSWLSPLSIPQIASSLSLLWP